MALPVSELSAARDVLEQTRDHVVQRLLTTTEDGSGPPRKDVMILFFGDFALDTLHHLETIDLLVAAGITPQRFHGVAEERLAGHDASSGDLRITPFQDTATPCEVQLSSSVLVRLWYFQSAALYTMLAAQLPESRLFIDLSSLNEDARSELNVAIGSVSNPRFNHYFFDQRAVSSHQGDDGSKGEEQLGSLKICFQRKVPVFDALEVLELDQKASDFASLMNPSQPSKTFQPRRWRSKNARDCIFYILPANAHQAGPAAEHKICTLLGAASAEFIAADSQNIDMSDLEPDYGLSYGSSSTSQAKQSTDVPVVGPLPPAEKVYHRIRWDESINENDIEIQYLDRHEGIMKKAFSEWLRDTEEEDFVPMHRIRAFVRRSDGVVLWDRVKKIYRLAHN